MKIEELLLKHRLYFDPSLSHTSFRDDAPQQLTIKPSRWMSSAGGYQSDPSPPACFQWLEFSSAYHTRQQLVSFIPSSPEIHVWMQPDGKVSGREKSFGQETGFSSSKVNKVSVDFIGAFVIMWLMLVKFRLKAVRRVPLSRFTWNGLPSGKSIILPPLEQKKDESAEKLEENPVTVFVPSLCERHQIQTADFTATSGKILPGMTLLTVISVRFTS